MRATFAIGVIAAASLLAGCGSRNQHGAKLALARVAPAGSGIYRMSEDGCCLEQVTHPPPGSIDFGPAWSPDAKRIAFVRGSRTTNARHLYVIDADGGRARPIPGVAVEGEGLSWSPDGTRIVFAARDGLRTASPTGRGTALLVRTKGAGSPGWSPDGRTLVFAATFSVYLADADGSNVRHLAGTGFASADSPAWSPDGKQIAYVDGGSLLSFGASPRLKIIRVDGGDARTITKLEGGAGSVVTLAWSPAGKRLVFSSIRGDTHGLFTVPVSGGSPRLLLKGVVGDPSFARAG